MSRRTLTIALSLLVAAGCGKTPKPPSVQAQTGPPEASEAAPAQPATGAGASPASATVGGAQPAAAATFVIPAGTEIHVRLDRTLDTKRDRAGRLFGATLASPVLVDGRVIVPSGTAFEGRVVEAKESGRLKGRAVLGLALVSFHLNGATYSIETGPTVRTSHSHKRRNLALIGGGSGGGAAIGAIAGGGPGALIGAGAGAAAGVTTAFITGKKNVRLPAETPLYFSLRNQVQVPAAS
jgi:hypothetical protein